MIRPMARRPQHPKTRLRLPNLEFPKTAELSSSTNVDGQRGYGHAIAAHGNGGVGGAEFVDGTARSHDWP
jgi:hypothetical protein